MPDRVAIVGEATVEAERYCRRCAEAQEVLTQGLAPGPTGAAEWQIWPGGWWCSRHRRAVAETGTCPDFRPGGPGGPRVVQATY